jgi:hypothetical protein
MRARSAARNAAIDTEIDLLHMAIMTYRNEYGSFPPSSSEIAVGTPMARHLQRVFPRCDVATHLPNVVSAGGAAITPQNALVSWLRGYTLDPTSPLLPQASRRKLFDFDQARVAGGYAPAGRANSPYIYIDSTQYGTVASPTQFVVGSGTYRAQTQVLSSGTVFFNPDTFQILCAGLDGSFGLLPTDPVANDDLSNFWRGTREQHAAANQ